MKIYIDYLRAFACLAVVVIHVTGGYYGHENVGNDVWWLANILGTAACFAVPVFIMISGCLLLGRDMRAEEFYKKRAARLLPPLLFWSALYLILNSLLKTGSFSTAFPEAFYKMLITGQAHYHLWFLSMFICLMLFYPLINDYVLGRKPTPREFAYLFAVLFLFYLVNQFCVAAHALWNVNIVWYKEFPWYFVYFILGYVIDRHAQSIKVNTLALAAFLGILVALSAGLKAMAMNKYGTASLNFVLIDSGVFIGLISVAVFSLFKVNEQAFTPNRSIVRIAEASLGIYLIHPLFLSMFNRIPGYYANGILYMPAAIVCVFAASYVSITVLRKNKYLRMVC